MSAFWGAPQSRNANYYDVVDAKKEDIAYRDKAREELKEIIALELEEDAAHGKVFNTCSGCGHMLWHSNTRLAQECGKVV